MPAPALSGWPSIAATRPAARPGDAAGDDRAARPKPARRRNVALNPVAESPALAPRGEGKGGGRLGHHRLRPRVGWPLGEGLVSACRRKRHPVVEAQGEAERIEPGPAIRGARGRPDRDRFGACLHARRDLSARFTSRICTFFFRSSRLSKSFFPVQRATSTFPRAPLKYILSGISAFPPASIASATLRMSLR